MFNFTDPFDYDDCLTLEEKRNLKFNTRQKISREMIEFMTEAGLSHDDPKMIIKNSYSRQSKIINDKYRVETYMENSRLFSGYRLFATLDTRTCLVCGSLDGKVFDTPEAAMAHKCLNENCRCVVLPVIKGMEEKDDDDTRAAMDGPVSANMAYEKWLKKQPIKRKREILGKYYDMYKEGASLTELIKAHEGKKTSSL